MGWMRSEDGGIYGDEPWDILEDAIDRIVEVYKAQIGRPPTHAELLNSFHFVTSHYKREKECQEK